MSSKTIDNWEGKTLNGHPVVSDNSDQTITCNVETFQGTDKEGNYIYENNCNWSGKVSELEKGQCPIGSKPRALKCPKCGRQVAYQADTTSPGYWNNKL